MELDHKTHPVSELLIQTCARKKWLLRRLNCKVHAHHWSSTHHRQETPSGRFGTNLMGKNIIKIKQTLQGKSQEEWEATAEYLQKLNFHNTLKDVLQNIKRLPEVIRKLELTTYSIASSKSTYLVKRDLALFANSSWISNFLVIHELIKEGKSVELMHAAAPPEDITPVEQILVLDPVLVVGEPEEEEMIIMEEEEHLLMNDGDDQEADHDVTDDIKSSSTSTTLTFQVGSRQVRDPYMLQFLDKVRPVTNTNWLGSGIINRAMEILKQQNPGISGLYFSTLGGNLEYP
ncbi:hypothetical protein DAPPUDRAFT_335582 [Daphnia pulex]|uniref:Uncharacterized protein n=1 Tax=Daphnia pulex TaxID=6669 RepID=E9HY26_DAPPU|nr:hypothetical protein DAPPUDRAFT_335582 [Daphnia pulex]|eukprot:EFX63354.1 hypothetical protein DAPPUDRAFT_335582 [Daphnia pulex]